METERSFKRSVSPHQINGIKKRAKVTDGLWEFLGLNNSNSTRADDTNGVHDDTTMSRDETPSMAKFNRFRSEKLGNRNISDITALKLYHESLKKQNNDRYNELLGETTSMSTSVSVRDYDDQTFNNDETNNTVVQHPLRGQKRRFQESRDSSMVVPNGLQQQRQVSIPNLRQQISRINPRERSNLINLKRKMKLDAYYKRKMNYLNYYNQNNVNSNTASLMNSMATTNTSFQPLRSGLDLQSTKRLAKPDAHVDKKPKQREITNRLGVFNGSFMYDLEEDEDEDDKSKIEYKPISVDLKVEKSKYGPKSLAPGMENILNGSSKKELALPEEESKPVTQEIKMKPLVNKPVAATTADIVGPSSGFTFANGNTKSSVPEKKDEKPAFSFAPDKKSDHVPTPTPTQAPQDKQPSTGFSFNNAQKTETKEQQTFSFGALAASKETNNHGFSFGSSVPAKPIYDSKPVEPAAEEAKPKFNFGASSSGFSMGEKPKQDGTAPPAKMEFVFGDKAKPATNQPASSTQAIPAAKPSFVFGDQSKQDAPAAMKTGFTSNDKPKEDGGVPKTEFNFFAKGTEPSKPSVSAPQAGFNFADTSKKLSFGSGSNILNGGDDGPREEGDRKRRFAGSLPDANTTNMAEQKSESAVTNKPALAFDFGTTKIESPKPTQALNFNNGSMKTSFNFGATAQQPASLNGNSTTPSISSDAGTAGSGTGTATTTAAKPVFNFGSTTTNTNTGFGATNTVVSSKESTPAATSEPKFNFGGASKFSTNNNNNGPSTPFANSGNSTSPAPPGGFNVSRPVEQTFQFGGSGTTPTNPAIVFGANSNANANAVVPQSGFSFGTSSNAGSTFNPSRSATPNFNFAGSTTVNPTMVFGKPDVPQQQQPQQQPGNVFGVNAQPMFGFNPQQQQQQPQQQQQQGNLFGTGSPVSSGTPIPSRKLARMRQPRSHR